MVYFVIQTDKIERNFVSFILRTTKAYANAYYAFNPQK